MDRRIVHNLAHEKLVQRIHSFGNDTREHRQVHKRLLQVLPNRLQNLITGYHRQGLSIAQSTRLAYTSQEFQQYIDEIIQVGFVSLEAKIQYETHMMLVEARQTLRRRIVRSRT